MARATGIPVSLPAPEDIVDDTATAATDISDNEAAFQAIER